MANISLLSRLVNGVQRQVDLSANTLVLGGMQLKGSTSGNLTQLANATTTTYTVTWPAAVAAASGYALTSDTSGNLSWSAISGAATSALDGTFTINNTADPTKKIAFSAATISTGTTRTITMPDANVNLGSIATAIQASGSVAFTANQPMGGFKLTGLAAGTTAGDSVRYEQAVLVSGVNAFTASQSMGGFNLTNLANGVNPQDATTLSQVQGLVLGLSWKTVVRSATTAALAANTYANGASGVGATLTGNANGALAAQDGVTLGVNDRLLVKNEATAANNGIYVVTQVGSGGTPYILTRATDSNTAALLTSEAVQVGAEASTQAGYGFRMASTSITVGTTALNYTNWSVGIGYTFGNGLTTSGSVVSALANPTNPSIAVAAAGLSVLLNAAGAITSSASGLQIALNGTNPGLAITSNALDVKYNAAGAIVANAAGITWNPDGSSLEISSNAARIKTTAYDQATITGGGGSAAAVQYAPAVKFAGVAGQAFSANTTYAVRFGLPQNSETAGRLYACDITTTSYDLFWCVGIIQPTSAVSIAGAVTVIQQGAVNNLSSDTNFGANDPGKALFLQSGGTQATTTAPSTSGQAVAKLGIATSTTSWFVQIGAPYVY